MVCDKGSGKNTTKSYKFCGFTITLIVLSHDCSIFTHHVAKEYSNTSLNTFSLSAIFANSAFFGWMRGGHKPRDSATF